MTRKNMAVVRRVENNRGFSRPQSQENHPPPEKTVVVNKNDEKLYLTKGEQDEDWEPSRSSVLKLLFSLRISSALWGIISDCDEVYNYWEPLHLFLFGRGFQTWEYSPVYAIRSYFYILLHYVPASFLALFLKESKIVIFVCMRCTLGVFCLFGEYLLYKAICKKINIACGRYFVIFTLFSSGMFISSTAFLPSSFSMILNFYFLTAYLNEQWWLAIGCTALSALVGWPFAAVLGLPVVIEMFLIRQKHVSFAIWSAVFGISITVMMYLCDSFYFGKNVVAYVNIVIYNVFGGPGPELYGVEPMSYYIKNLFLNWNFAAFLAVFAIPLSGYCYKLHHKTHEVHNVKFGIPRSLPYWRRFIPVFLIGLAAASWCAIFLTQPHKEERFLFPIYPHIAFLAAVAFEAIERLSTKKNSSIGRNFWITVFVYIIASLSRTYGIHANYGAHIEIYKSLNEHLTNESFQLDNMNNPVRVCVGKEWYRFPSSFFLPENVGPRDNARSVELSFIRSAFRGILPQPFLKSNNLVDMTRHIPSKMNDMNQEEMSRYVQLDTCDFFIDVDMPENEFEPNLRGMVPDKLQVINQIPFIVSSSSHVFFRAFYIPFYSKKYTHFTNYTLYKRV